MKIGFLKRDHVETFVIPSLFVWLWSTGFIGAKYSTPYAEPFTILWTRMSITVVILGIFILLIRAPWPKERSAIWHSMVVGVLVHVAFLGGIFSAIEAGMPAGVTSVITGVQPIATAIFAALWIGTSLTLRQNIGLVLGFVGIVCVLLGNHLMEATSLIKGVNTQTVSYAVMALIGISLGTLYQKQFCSNVPLLSGAFIQFTITAAVAGVVAFGFEPEPIQWTMPYILSILWLVFGLSLTAMMLLLYMIRRGKVEKVASLFYLVAPVTAIEAYFLFDERLNWIAIAGIFVTVLGVYLVISLPKPVPAKT